MAASKPRNFTAGSITLSDDTGTPISLTVALGEGDFSIENLQSTLNAVKKYESRGRFSGAAYAERIYPTFTLTAKVAEFTDATTGTLADAVLKNGAFSSAVSTLGTGTKEVYALDVTFDLEVSDYEAAESDGQFVAQDCVLSIAFAEGDPSTFQLSGEVLGAITGDLAAAELAA